jgi:hypothetical protein
MKEVPYIEDGSIRTFPIDVDNEELEWHVDFEDRDITVLQSGGWLLQLDNEIPKPLRDGQKIFIKSFSWHRIMKGREPLIVKIIKLS